VSFAYTSMQDRKIPLEFPVTGRVMVLRNTKFPFTTTYFLGLGD